MIRVAVLTLSVWAAGTATARAQSAPAGSWDATPFLGVAFGDDIETTVALGVAGSYRYDLRLAFEGEIGYLPDIAGDTSALDVSVLTVSANGLYHFQFYEMEPYVTLGIGLSRVNAESRDEDTEVSESEFAFNLGVGVKRRVGTRTAVRGDLRYINANDSNPNFWRLYGGVSFRFGP